MLEESKKKVLRIKQRIPKLQLEDPEQSLTWVTDEALLLIEIAETQQETIKALQHTQKLQDFENKFNFKNNRTLRWYLCFLSGMTFVFMLAFGIATYKLAETSNAFQAYKQKETIQNDKRLRLDQVNEKRASGLRNQTSEAEM